jgi:hypothetical protein
MCALFGNKANEPGTDGSEPGNAEFQWRCHIDGV